MNNILGAKGRWLALALAGTSWLSIAPALAGPTPAGVDSGVTTTGSSPLTIGGSSLGGLIFDLERRTDITLSIDDGPPVAQVTPRQTADNTAAAIAADSGVTVTTRAGTLVIAALSPSETDPDQVTTTAVYTPQEGCEAVPPDAASHPDAALTETVTAGCPITATLVGSRDQVVNAAAFLAAASGSRLTPDPVAVLVDFALAGASYGDLVNLFNALGGRPIADVLAPTANIASPQLGAIIQAFNQILDASTDNTVILLNEDTNFTALSQSLQQLRTAVN